MWQRSLFSFWLLWGVLLISLKRGLNPWILCLLIMNEIPIASQRYLLTRLVRSAHMISLKIISSALQEIYIHRLPHSQHGILSMPPWNRVVVTHDLWPDELVDDMTGSFDDLRDQWPQVEWWVRRVHDASVSSRMPLLQHVNYVLISGEDFRAFANNPHGLMELGFEKTSALHYGVTSPCQLAHSADMGCSGHSVLLCGNYCAVAGARTWKVSPTSWYLQLCRHCRKAEVVPDFA